MIDRRAYIIKQSVTGAAISIMMGSVLFLAVHHGKTELPVWGSNGLIADCLPQGFMVGLMSVLPAVCRHGGH